MIEDRRAHKRIDNLNELMEQHTQDISDMRVSLLRVDTNISSLDINTSEIVAIMRGAKGTYSVIWAMAKLFGAITIIVGFISGIWYTFVHYIQEGIK